MRKLLLLSSLAMIGLKPFAQQMPVVPNSSYQQQQRPVVLLNSPKPAIQTGTRSANTNTSSRSITNSVRLNSIRIGSAGNLLTADEGNANQIDINDVLNAVAFIHRNDPSQFGATVALYRYDGSWDGGNTWISNIGPITQDPAIDNDSIACRFPQAVIFNPDGNTIADSAYMVYSGTWHNTIDGWKGQSRGRGYLSTDSNSYNVHIDSVNGGAVAIATGMCHGAPGVFWNINMDYPWDAFHSGVNLTTDGIIIEKGVWDSTTRDVVWKDSLYPAPFVSVNSDGINVSIITSLNIAFDPTGQYGWACGLGDLSNVNSGVYDPIFWRTTDGGNTWSAPVEVLLDSLPNVVNWLVNNSNTLYTGGPTSLIPTAEYDEDLVVDYLGNPHMVMVVANSAGGYSFPESAPYSAWDITFTATPGACDTVYKGFKAVFLSPVETFQGTLSDDNPSPITEDNRPLACASPDGTRVFLFWVDTDINFTQLDENDFPNLFTIGEDLLHHTFTPVVNLTIGDSLWGGETVNTNPGLFYGAPFGTVSPIASQRGSTYNVPLVLTQIDYNKPATQQLGSYLNPCAFWYINNVNFDTYDFINGLSAQVYLNGPDTVQALLNNPYIDQGAYIVYGDTSCYPSGPLNLVIDSDNVNYNQLGYYVIRYFAENDSGIIYGGTTRIVDVGRPPVAAFGYHTSGGSNRIQFEDSSQYNPTSWSWSYGDGFTGQTQDPLHVYTNKDSSYNVCLIVSNAYGTSSQVCKTVSVIAAGIDDIAFAENINLYPNPSTGKVSISVTESVPSEITVSVLDLQGQTVVGESKYQAGTNLIEMDLSSLASGMYFVKVYSPNQGTAIKYLTIANK